MNALPSMDPSDVASDEKGLGLLSHAVEAEAEDKDAAQLEAEREKDEMTHVRDRPVNHVITCTDYTAASRT